MEEGGVACANTRPAETQSEPKVTAKEQVAHQDAENHHGEIGMMACATFSCHAGHGTRHHQVPDRFDDDEDDEEAEHCVQLHLCCHLQKCSGAVGSCLAELGVAHGRIRTVDRRARYQIRLVGLARNRASANDTVQGRVYSESTNGLSHANEPS